MLDQNVDNNDLEVKVNDEEIEKDKDTEEENDETWKDTQKVPYRRLEAQSRKAQKLEEELNELKSKFNSLTKTEQRPSGTWDNRIKNAQTWDEVFNELPKEFVKTLLENPEMKSQFVSAVKSELKSDEKQVEEKVNREIDNLWDKGLITSKDQENKVIKYAIKESEESGEYVPLSVAIRMMKKEGVWDKKIEDRKDANNKVRPGFSSSSNKTVDKTSYNKFKHESLDAIISDAASKFGK